MSRWSVFNILFNLEVVYFKLYLAVLAPSKPLSTLLTLPKTSQSSLCETVCTQHVTWKNPSAGWGCSSMGQQETTQRLLGSSWGTYFLLQWSLTSKILLVRQLSVKWVRFWSIWDTKYTDFFPLVIIFIPFSFTSQSVYISCLWTKHFKVKNSGQRQRREVRNGIGYNWNGFNFFHSSLHNAMDEIYNQNSADNTQMFPLLLNSVCPDKPLPVPRSAPTVNTLGVSKGLGGDTSRKRDQTEEVFHAMDCHTASHQQGVGVWAWELPGHKPTHGRWRVTASLALVWVFFPLTVKCTTSVLCNLC